LKQALVAHNAFEVEGIFRLAGESLDVARTKQLLNAKNGIVPEDVTDVNTLSTLLKVCSSFFFDKVGDQLTAFGGCNTGLVSRTSRAFAEFDPSCHNQKCRQGQCSVGV
jgi:hypothetical protein